MLRKISGGTVVTASDVFEADVVIENGRITGLVTPGTGPADAQTIDAKGCYVIPGGIDAHTHLDMPFGGTTSIDDFESGTIAAAFGGTTSIVDFAIIAFAIFLVVKAMNSMQKKEEAAPAPPPPEVALLTEIRDTLRSR